MNNINKLITKIAVLESSLDEERYNLAVANDAISDLMDKNLDKIDRIAELEDRIKKLEKRNQDLSDTKYAMHKAYKELEMDLESAENEIALCHKDIKKLNQKINLKNYLIDKLSRAIMLISK